MSLTESRYKDYFCSRNAPLSCDQAQQTVQEFPKAKYCLECGFPANLPQKEEIKGSRGTYQVTRLLGYRGIGRLYSGIQLHDSQPVVIKEYLLPTRSFNAQETRQRQDTFVHVAGVSPADGRSQDFRLISPWEVIADQRGKRCYTITKGNLEASQTLSQYLIEKGAMTATQVREVLYQALQTLQFLHTQKLRLPSGQVQQGMSHGNLSLDSVLIVQNERQYFTIYLCDLAVWEGLFEPPSFAQPSIPKPEQDLEELGRIAFYLWVGRAADYTSRQPLDPRDEQQWPNSDPNLKQFLYRLIGLDTPFESAEAARQALLQLSTEGQANSSIVVADPEQTEKALRKPLILLLLGTLALLLLGGGIWYFLKRGAGSQADDVRVDKLLVPSFSDVNGIPPGDFTYTGEKVGTWSYVLSSRLMGVRLLEEILTKPKPLVNAQFIYKPVSSANIITASQPIKELRAGRAQFAMTSQVDDLRDDLDKKQVAYDGLLVFVAFSVKQGNLPKALQGQISLEHLRQIYTHKITNWQQLGGPDLGIIPFAPNDPEAERQFQKLVLKNEQDIHLYKEKITRQPTKTTQNQIGTEFDEGRAGIISYGIFSKTWDQCAGYFLALVDGKKPASQVFFQISGDRPIDPSDNLCKKANRLDFHTLVTSYPLRYPLFVVYPKDNRLPPAGLKFAELLTTLQGQCLLSKAGLVPLHPVPEKSLNSNDCK